MTTRFINDDALLKNGGSKAVRIKQSDLAHRMYKLGEKFFHEEWGDDEQLELPDDETWYRGNCYDELIQYLMKDSTLLSDVSKYNVGCCSEATFDGMASNGTTNLTGMHTLANGLTFYGFFLSVDCGPSCAFVIIYHDGRKLRAYMPTYGNTVNVDCKCVLGVEYEHMDNMSKIETKYKKAGIWREDEDLFRMYLAKYELDSEFCYWDAIQSDIEARIEILDE